MSVVFTFSDMRESFIQSGVVDIVLALGYKRVKDICVKTLDNTNEDHTWLSDAVSITGLDSDIVDKKFQQILYKFELLSVNKWIFP